MPTKFLDSTGLGTLWANCKAYFARKAHQQAGSTIYDLTDVIYPVGSIYISTSSTSPATLFGGTWEQLSDRYLVAAGSNYTAGTTGVGNFKTDAGIAAKGYGTTSSSPTYNGRVVTTASSSSTHNNSTSSTKTLADSGFTFDPPYLAVYMWKRLTLAGNQPIEPDPASPNSISAGTSAPSGGINGDIYIQY